MTVADEPRRPVVTVETLRGALDAAPGAAVVAVQIDDPDAECPWCTVVPVKELRLLGDGDDTVFAFACDPPGGAASPE